MYSSIKNPAGFKLVVDMVTLDAPEAPGLLGKMADSRIATETIQEEPRAHGTSIRARKLEIMQKEK